MTHLSEITMALLARARGTSTLRYHPQGTSYAAMLLTMPVRLPKELPT